MGMAFTESLVFTSGGRFQIISLHYFKIPRYWSMHLTFTKDYLCRGRKSLYSTRGVEAGVGSWKLFVWNSDMWPLQRCRECGRVRHGKTVYQWFYILLFAGNVTYLSSETSHFILQLSHLVRFWNWGGQVVFRAQLLVLKRKVNIFLWILLC